MTSYLCNGYEQNTPSYFLRVKCHFFSRKGFVELFLLKFCEIHIIHGLTIRWAIPFYIHTGGGGGGVNIKFQALTERIEFYGVTP